MKLKSVVTFILALIVVLATPACTTHRGLRFELRPLSTEVTLGEPIYIGLRLSNESTTPLSVYIVDVHSTVDLAMTTAEGEQLPWRGLTLDPGLSPPQTLAPGAGSTSIIALAHSFPIVSEGEYLVHATYRSLRGGSPPADIVVAAVPATIRVLAPPDDDAREALSLVMSPGGVIEPDQEAWARHPKTAAGQGAFVDVRMHPRAPVLAHQSFAGVSLDALLPRYRCMAASVLARANAEMGDVAAAERDLAIAAACTMLEDDILATRELLQEAAK